MQDEYKKHDPENKVGSSTADNEFQAVEKPELKSDRKKAIIYANLYCIIAALYQLMAKIATAQKGVNVLDLCLIRTTVNFAIANCTVTYNNKHVINDVPSKFWGILYFRALCGTVGFTTMVYSLQFLPLFVHTIIFNTAPFWCALLGYCVLGDTITWLEMGMMMGCFSGVIVLALSKGGFFVETEIQIDMNETTESLYSNVFLFGLIMSYITSWAFSAVTVITRKISEIHFSLMMFHYGLFATIVLSIVIVAEYLMKDQETYRHGLPENCISLRLFCYDSDQWLFLIFISIFNAVSMNFMTIASQHEKSSFVASITYIGLIYSLLFDIFYFDITFNRYEIVGAVIIIIFNVGNIILRIQKGK